MSQIKIIAKADTPPLILSAFSFVVNMESIERSNPPPSKIFAGYKFISASARLQRTKKSDFSPLRKGKSKTNIADTTLNIIPPRHTSASFT